MDGKEIIDQEVDGVDFNIVSAENVYSAVAEQKTKAPRKG
jgi:hypothetical protein